ncbi:MAG: M81 family metallopeptidase [Anaerolineae bacterium]
MKLFMASISTETNTFSPIPTGYRSYAEDGYLIHNGQHLESVGIGTQRILEHTRTRGWTLVDSIHAFAQPAGLTVRKVYEDFRDEMLADLRAAMPVDAVILPLHGAMVAEGYPDCEGDMLRRVREIVGPGVPIGATLDPHCHLTDDMLNNADVLIAYKEYPHTDIADRTDEVFEIIAGMLAGTHHPTTHVFDCRMIGVYHTTRDPMRQYVDDMMALERADADVLSISVAHCFPWGDVPDMGTKVWVITNNQPEKAAALAREWGERLYSLRHALIPPVAHVTEALDQVSAILATQPDKPVVLADATDNTGGGAPGDSTFILQAMLQRGFEGVALSSIYDPVAVKLAFEAGIGATLDMRIGGKMGPFSGQPLDLRVTIKALSDDLRQQLAWDGHVWEVSMGRAALLSTGGVDMIINDKRMQTFVADHYRALGIDPTQKRVLVVKSSQHFQAAYAPLASAVVYCDAPGALNRDFASLPYQHVDRNKFPFVDKDTL